VRRSILIRGTVKSSGIRCGWRARGDVTSHAVTASVGWPEARGGPCEARELACAVIRVRAEVRGFETCALLSAMNCRGRTEDVRALCKDKRSRTPEPYRPSLILSGGTVENIRALCKEKGRERPSLMLNGGKVENT